MELAFLWKYEKLFYKQLLQDPQKNNLHIQWEKFPVNNIKV